MLLVRTRLERIATSPGLSTVPLSYRVRCRGVDACPWGPICPRADRNLEFGRRLRSGNSYLVAPRRSVAERPKTSMAVSLSVAAIGIVQWEGADLSARPRALFRPGTRSVRPSYNPVPVAASPGRHTQVGTEARGSSVSACRSPASEFHSSPVAPFRCCLAAPPRLE